MRTIAGAILVLAAAVGFHAVPQFYEAYGRDEPVLVFGTFAAIAIGLLGLIMMGLGDPSPKDTDDE